MPNIDSILGRLTGSTIPVLFLDTCILLDIVRSTMRDLGKYAEEATRLLGLATGSAPSCLIVISSVVPLEWARNIDKVTHEVTRNLVQMQRQSAHFHDACGALGIGLDFGRARYEDVELAGALRILSEKLLEASCKLDADHTTRAGAYERVINSIPPALKKQEIKDCVLVEEYLDACRALQSASYQGRLVFCTSNKEDFCLDSTIHPRLASEFDEVGLIFKAKLPGALHQLTH